MLIARAPFRISFAGGGTDLEAYYGRYGGLVVSAAIDKYFYIFINVNNGTHIQITSSDYHAFYRHSPSQEFFWDGDLALPKAILHHFGLEHGLTMFMASEVPPGTGLGSSSAVAVAIIKGLSSLLNRRLSRQEIAELACQMEIEKLGMPIGKQDQYASAFGGLNAIYFGREGCRVEPLRLAPEVLARLEQSLLLFFTGSSRNSATILREQKKSSEEEDEDVIRSLHAIRAMAEEVKECLLAGDLRRLGQLLHAGWEHKKRLARGITNEWIDECYEIALANGALGGKITGAGGGGFLMFFCPQEHQEAVTAALVARGLNRMDFHFDFGGARILLNATRSLGSRQEDRYD